MPPLPYLRALFCTCNRANNIGNSFYGIKILYIFMQKWLSGRASPCQGEGRGFESRLLLHKRTNERIHVRLSFFIGKCLIYA